jgi:hypothetical protein
LLLVVGHFLALYFAWLQEMPETDFQSFQVCWFLVPERLGPVAQVLRIPTFSRVVAFQQESYRLVILSLGLLGLLLSRVLLRRDLGRR